MEYLISEGMNTLENIAHRAISERDWDEGAHQKDFKQREKERKTIKGASRRGWMTRTMISRIQERMNRWAGEEKEQHKRRAIQLAAKVMKKIRQGTQKIYREFWRRYFDNIKQKGIKIRNLRIRGKEDENIT
jgi:hypothetical protein